jgi:hypothetical protein
MFCGKMMKGGGPIGEFLYEVGEMKRGSQMGKLMVDEMKVFASNSSLGEQIKGAYMPSWVFLGMTAVEERVRKRTTKL